MIHPQLVVARKYLAVPLELLEEAFDQMALLVQMIIHRPQFPIVAFGRDGIIRSHQSQTLPEPLSTVCLIAQHRAAAEIYAIYEALCMDRVMVIAGREQKA